MKKFKRLIIYISLYGEFSKLKNQNHYGICYYLRHCTKVKIPIKDEFENPEFARATFFKSEFPEFYQNRKGSFVKYWFNTNEQRTEFLKQLIKYTINSILHFNLLTTKF